MSIRFPRTFLLVGLLLFSVTAAFGQATPNQPDPTPTATVAAQAAASPQSSPAKPAGPPEPRVVKVVGDLELDDIIEVNLENLEEWAETHDANQTRSLH
jgi:hypothetical protein